MVQTAKLRWKIYFFLAAPLMLSGFFSLLTSDTNAYVYYNVLIAFHENYTLAYFLAIAAAATNVAMLIPVGFFIFRIRLFKEGFWRGFFFLKILLDIFGHHFEFNFLKSLVFAELWQVALTLAAIAVVFFPSYWAFYLYAFRRGDIFKNTVKT